MWNETAIQSKTPRSKQIPSEFRRIVIARPKVNSDTAKTVCLVMIVKDEAAVIRRCLESVKSLIDYWIICDTAWPETTGPIIHRTLPGVRGGWHKWRW